MEVRHTRGGGCRGNARPHTRTPPHTHTHTHARPFPPHQAVAVLMNSSSHWACVSSGEVTVWPTVLDDSKIS